jgi:hypothetical protein
MLMPAGVLIVLLLGAISFDLSLLFLRQRQSASVAADVANDIATEALDEQVFRATGDFELDPERAQAIAEALLRRSDVGGELVEAGVEVLPDPATGGDAVRVRLVVRVEYVFAKAIPGAADSRTVTASATAVARAG